MTNDRAPTDNEVEAFERDALLEDPGSISAEHYPRLFNVSAAFWAADELPPELSKVADRGDVNLVSLPRTPTRYHAYAPLFHLAVR